MSDQGTATCANSDCTEHGNAKPFGGFDPLPDVIICGTCSQRCTITLTAGSAPEGP